MTGADRHPSLDFRKRYGVLLDIGRILTATLRPSDLYRSIYEQASRVLETTGFYISLYSAERDLATVVFYADRGEIVRTAVTYRGSDSRAIREARPILEQLEAPDRAIMVLGQDADEEITRSVIAAPMLREGQVLGVISAQSYRASAYDEADLKLLCAIADHAAVAIHNASTLEEMERQRRESQQLVEISRALTSSLELDEVLQRIVTATRQLADSDGAEVWLLRDDGRAEIARTAGRLALDPGTVVLVPPSMVEQLSQGRPLVFDARDPARQFPPELRHGIRAESAIAVPMLAEGELLGALSISHRKARDHAPGDVRLLERVAYHAAIAVANARLHEQVRQLSLTDPLTELPNRRHMEMILEREFAAAERGRPLAVVLFDLDDFKRYNDTAGHQAGDTALRRFARLMAGETRAMNLAARYGGDEFICILSDTDLQGGAIHAGRVMRAVKNDRLLRGIGVSAGIAAYEEGMRNAQELIRRADEELYRAKSQRGQQTTPP